MATIEPKTRLHFIDSTRGLAVVLAMLSHSLWQFAPEMDLLRPLTQTATPTFVVLFGVMLELVYLRRLRDGAGAEAIEKRMLGRMLTCFFVFALILFAAFATSKLSLHSTLKALIFMGGGRFGVILKTYAVLFAVVLLLLPLARRHGATLFLAAAGLAWGVKVGLDSLGIDGPYPMRFLLGTGEGFGPAILPALSFVGFGIAFGEVITGRRGPALLLGCLAVALALVAWELSQSGALAAIDRWVLLRWSNHPIYFAAGILMTSLYLLFFHLLWRMGAARTISTSLANFGTKTLFIYGFGNVALNLLPIYEGQVGPGLFLALLYMIGLLALSCVGRATGTALDRLSNRFLAIWDRVLSAMVTVLAESLLRRIQFLRG